MVNSRLQLTQVTTTCSRGSNDICSPLTAAFDRPEKRLPEEVPPFLRTALRALFLAGFLLALFMCIFRDRERAGRFLFGARVAALRIDFRGERFTGLRFGRFAAALRALARRFMSGRRQLTYIIVPF
jgi:hypothetical protein